MPVPSTITKAADAQWGKLRVWVDADVRGFVQ